MTRRAIATSWALMWLIAPATGRAQDAPAMLRLTLAEAVARAYETSHRLAELAARQGASEASAQGAAAGRWPTISVQGGYSRTNHVEEFSIIAPGPPPTREVIYPDVPDNFRTRLDLQWPIYTGGRTESLMRAARAEAAASADDAAAARAELRLEVSRAYWALVTARESVVVVQGALDRVAAQLRDARARLDAGFVAPSDVLSAEARQSLQQALLVEARNNVETSQIALQRLIGVPAQTTIEPAEPLDSPPVPASDTQSLIAEALAARQDRRALASRTEAAAARTDAARSGFKPFVALFSGVDYARPNPKIFPRSHEWNSSWDVGLSANWTLFDFGRVRADVGAADALRRAAQERLAELDTQIDAEVRQRRTDLESARASASATADAVRSAAEARRVLQNRYNAGVATSTEVLDAQVTELQAQLERTRALANVRLAAARLERALGHD